MQFLNPVYGHMDVGKGGKVVVLFDGDFRPLF